MGSGPIECGEGEDATSWRVCCLFLPSYLPVIREVADTQVLPVCPF